MKPLLMMVMLVSAVAAFANGPVWETDYAAAKARAEKENKTLLVNFSGSDWCGWCKKLDREVFRKNDFLDFAKDELVLVQVDFPRYKKLPADEQRANESLMRKFRVRGFPTVLLVDTSDRVLLYTGYYPGGAQAYVDHLKPHVN
jgi:protein disulfide-isomerase